MSVTTFARVDPETLEIILKYNTNGGAKWTPEDIECTIPFEILADQAIRSDSGEITLQTDPAKVQARLDAQWASVRSQQRDLLYKSDWTCSVTDLPESILAKRAQWLEYRQALRDITKSVTDPTKVEWPTAP